MTSRPELTCKRPITKARKSLAKSSVKNKGVAEVKTLPKTKREAKAQLKMKAKGIEKSPAGAVHTNKKAFKSQQSKVSRASSKKNKAKEIKKTSRTRKSQC